MNNSNSQFQALNHKWDVSLQDAIAVQKALRPKVIIESFTKPLRYIAGADVSLNRFSEIIYAGIIVLDYNTLEPVTYSLVQSKTTFPYIPGLLSFREIPALMEAWQKLKLKPDVLVVDGQGIAHPRRLGIASHFGVLADTPTIGCAKSILTGTYSELHSQAGSISYIHDRYIKEEIIGAAIRTKNKVKPIIVSPGHRITLEQSIEILLRCIKGYRLPEPTRKAHILVNHFRTGVIKI